jgi:hypothetical protein
VPVSRAAFRNPEVERRSRVGYDELAATTRVRFIPFDEAWTELLTFIDEIAIPDDHQISQALI